jgi:hypothetical protein
MTDSRQKQVSDLIVSQITTAAVVDHIRTDGKSTTTKFPYAQLHFDDGDIDDSTGFGMDTHIIPLRITVTGKTAESVDLATQTLYNLFQNGTNFAALNAIGDGVAVFPRGRKAAFKDGENTLVKGFVDYDVNIRYSYSIA